MFSSVHACSHTYIYIYIYIYTHTHTFNFLSDALMIVSSVSACSHKSDQSHLRAHRESNIELLNFSFTYPVLSVKCAQIHSRACNLCAHCDIWSFCVRTCVCVCVCTHACADINAHTSDSKVEEQEQI